MSATKYTRIRVLVALTLAGLLAYQNSCQNDFHYDDMHSVVDNPSVRELGNIPRFFYDPTTFSANPDWRMYRPLLLVSYAINYRLASLEQVERADIGGVGPRGLPDVFGFHVVNFILHIANAWFVWLLATRLLPQGRLALTSALLFVIHPLLSEPVNYISSRSSLLCTLFCLAALYALATSTAGRFRWRDHALISMLFAAGLGSKSLAVALPALGFIYMWFTGSVRRQWQLLLGPVVLTICYVLGTAAIIGKAMLQPVRSMEAQWATQIKAAAFYLSKVFMPVNQSVEPQFSVSEHLWVAPVGAAALVLASLAVLCLRSGVRHQTTVLASCWAFASLLPSSLVPLNVLVNEHRLYLPMAAVAIALGSALVGCRRRVLLGFWACMIVLLALTVQRNSVWQNEEVLWADAAVKGPLMTRPHINLGKAYLDQDRYQEAIDESRRALSISPTLSRAHYNIGTAYLHQKKRESAIASYERALEITPRLMEAHNNLGNAYKQLGQYPEAIESFRRALEIVDNAAVYHNIGSAFLSAGLYDSAATYFRVAIEQDPDSRVSYNGLAKALIKDDRFHQAIAALQQGLSRWQRETDLLLLLGDAQARLGDDDLAAATYRRADLDDLTTSLRLGHQAQKRKDWERARRHFEEALEQSDSDARIHVALGEVWVEVGDAQKGLKGFRRAAELDPEMAAAYVNIGKVYLDHAGLVEAIAALERAVEIDVEHVEAWEYLAKAFGMSSKHQRAAEALYRAIALAPERSEPYHNLGMIQQQQGAWKEAERLYREALKRDPAQIQSFFNLGYVYLQQERYQEAVAACERAVELDRSNAGAYVNMARGWIGLGELEKALESYERALEQSSEADEWRRGVIGRIGEVKDELMRAKERDEKADDAL